VQFRLEKQPSASLHQIVFAHPEASSVAGYVKARSKHGSIPLDFDGLLEQDQREISINIYIYIFFFLSIFTYLYIFFFIYI